MSKAFFNEGIKYEIFVGIKDKDSYREVLGVDDFRDILTEICTEKKINTDAVLITKTEIEYCYI